MSSWGVIDQQLAGLSCAALTAGFVWLILHIFGHYSFLVLMLADISTCVYCAGSRLSTGLCYLVNKELLHFKNTELWHTKNKRQSSCCGFHSAFISPPLSLSGRQGVHAHSPSFPSCSQEWTQMVWKSSSHRSSQTIRLSVDFHKTCWKINQVQISAFKWVHSKREKRLWWLHCLMSFTIKIFEWTFK